MASLNTLANRFPLVPHCCQFKTLQMVLSLLNMIIIMYI